MQTDSSVAMNKINELKIQDVLPFPPKKIRNISLCVWGEERVSVNDVIYSNHAIYFIDSQVPGSVCTCTLYYANLLATEQDTVRSVLLTLFFLPTDLLVWYLLVLSNMIIRGKKATSLSHFQVILSTLFSYLNNPLLYTQKRCISFQ